MKRFAVALSILAISAANSTAADLSPRTYAKAPAMADPGYSWTGLYVGASVGGRWSDTTWTTNSIGGPPFVTTPPNFGTSPAGFDSASARIGGYVGYNWQVAPQWLVGLEGDVAWGDGRKSQAGIPGTFGPFQPGSNSAGFGATAFDSAEVREKWDASLRARFGFLPAPNWLLYVTGGAAWQSFNIRAVCNGTPVNTSFCSAVFDETARWTKIGWTVGAGTEFRVAGNWLGRLEYRYSDYGHVNHVFFAGTGSDVPMSQSLRTHTALLGLSYLFNSSPVVAKY